MSNTSLPMPTPYTSLLDLTPTPPTAPDIVRYAVLHGVRFLVVDWNAHAEQTTQSDAGEIAIGLIVINQTNVLRLLMGEYYAGDCRTLQ